jgi:hypothetical protein
MQIMSIKNLGSIVVLFSIASIHQSSSAHLGPISVSTGWHPWYEVQVDPEDQKDLIICGTKWDARQNGPFGFVYNSRDGGGTWQTALEDRRSAWVTEQSCAFGPKHAAYFISSAAKTGNGTNHHEFGKSRLFVSPDGGSHWSDGVETGWVDYSTSAVSSSTRSLYTFFNAETNDPGMNFGASVGLLRFSPDGRRVEGPFLNHEMRKVNYEGVFPSDATAIKNGDVVALYWGTRAASGIREADLGVVRADQSANPQLQFERLAHSTLESNCINFDSGSLAYDRAVDRLYVLYVDGCKETRIMLASSADEGRTWTNPTPVLEGEFASTAVANPSLVANAGVLALLWQQGQGSGQWRFSDIRDNQLRSPALKLSCTSSQSVVSNDALKTWIYQPDSPNIRNGNEPSEPSFTVKVSSELNRIWRARGLAIVDGSVIGVWSSGNDTGTHLYSTALPVASVLTQTQVCSGLKHAMERDVTEQTVLVYAGLQRFDKEASSIRLCLALENHGTEPIQTPIKIELSDLESTLGTPALMSALEKRDGEPVLDISSAVTGDQIPKGMTSNPFCLSFHINENGASGKFKNGDLLSFRAKVRGRVNQP